MNSTCCTDICSGPDAPDATAGKCFAVLNLGACPEWLDRLETCATADLGATPALRGRRGTDKAVKLANKRAAMAKARATRSALYAKTLPPSDAAARHRARSLVSARLASGAMVRPDSCSACGASVKPEAHHIDYSRPCDVLWLCRPCHCKVHLGTLVLDATPSPIGGVA